MVKGFIMKIYRSRAFNAGDCQQLFLGELFAGKWWMGWNAKVDLRRFERGDGEEVAEKDAMKMEVEKV